MRPPSDPTEHEDEQKLESSQSPWRLDLPYFLERLAIDAYQAGETEVGIYFYNLSHNKKNPLAPNTGAFFHRGKRIVNLSED